MNRDTSPADLRKDYRKASLDRSDLAADPMAQFEKWFADARAEPLVAEPNAMCLATADSMVGQPSARIVLLKGFDARGFVFFTNYESQKGRELSKNRRAALNFWWPPLERQIQIEGTVAKISAQESEIYFQSRPRESQIGAWASPQSQKIAERAAIEKKQAEIEALFAEKTALPLPPFWGGFCLEPDFFEFWQGRSSRLHDRFSYEKQPDGSWQIDRLAP